MPDALSPTSKHSSSPVEDNGPSTHVKIIKFSSIWTIDNFSSCVKETGKELSSSTFSVGVNEKLKWRLSAYPKGRDMKTEDYLSVFLGLAMCDKTEVQAKYKFSVLNNKGEEKKAMESVGRSRFSQDDHWGFRYFIRRDILLDKASKLLVNDKLTLCCEINIVADPIKISRQEQRFKIPECNLQDNMEMLFERTRFSDFILSVNGQEFFVHKNILASRSKVFAAMFEHEMEEKKQNRVEIIGMNTEVMKEMLRFFYTGKVACLKNIASDLLAAADKYSVDRLKAICEETIYANISVDTASDILVLADLHSADQLKAHVLNFITRHATEVSATSGWKTMVTQIPHLISEAFQALAIQHAPPPEPPRKKPKLN